MKLARLLSASAVLAIAAAATPAQAVIVTYSIVMDGPSESPPNASPGTGSGTVVFDDVAMTMHVTDSFSGLTGTTTASHIHCCTAVPGTLTAGVATRLPSFAGFPLGVTSGAFDSGLLDMSDSSNYNPAFITAHGGTTASAFAALLAGAAGGAAYLNIHSTAFPGGEIRSFLTPVPEPASGAMLLGGLLAVGALARRQRQP